MSEYLVAWFMKVEADSTEQAGIEAGLRLPSPTNINEATKMAVFEDPEVIDNILQTPSTKIDIKNLLEWASKQPPFLVKPNE